VREESDVLRGLGLEGEVHAFAQERGVDDIRQAAAPAAQPLGQAHEHGAGGLFQRELELGGIAARADERGELALHRLVLHEGEQRARARRHRGGDREARPAVRRPGVGDLRERRQDPRVVPRAQGERRLPAHARVGVVRLRDHLREQLGTSLRRPQRLLAHAGMGVVEERLHVPAQPGPARAALGGLRLRRLFALLQEQALSRRARPAVGGVEADLGEPPRPLFGRDPPDPAMRPGAVEIVAMPLVGGDPLGVLDFGAAHVDDVEGAVGADL
jgi:hypothetical protein